MNIFFKVAAGILTALILWLSLEKHNKDFSVLLSLGVCAMAVTAGTSFLQPVVSFLKKLQSLSNIDTQYLSIVLKTVGIGMVSEIASAICKDAGNASLGKALQFFASVMVLWMSVPIFEKLLTLLDNILGAV